MLNEGEEIKLGTRVDGGITVKCDPNVSDTYHIDGHAGELSGKEIKRLAELAGLEVA